jgi:NAD(P)-dependent dehydrogenase (short-subunit alcohol dehydrogenase family)
MFRLDGKAAVITGGGSGIGKAIAELFARQGAMVHILDFDQEGANAVATQINTDGGQAVAHHCNVADDQMVAEIINQIAQIDILVNNAGVAHVGNLEATPPDAFDRLYNVNVKGVYHLLRAVVPKMKAAGGGCIINMVSVAAWVGIPDRFAYTTTKGAVAAMTLSVAKDYLKDGIRCNSISPARIHTPFVDGFLAKNYPGREDEMFAKLAATQPIGRMGKPVEVAQLALFLASDEASFITGCDYPIDGGFIKLNA